MARPCFPGPPSSVEPYREFVKKKRREGVEIRALHGLLKEKGFKGGYSSVRRFVSRLEETRPEAYVRVETPPGEECQVDFGYAGLMFDEATGKTRKAWVFVMTLSWSRHMYAELVFDQKTETWLDLHVRAFDFFSGSVTRVVIDNLKAGIIRAVVHDAEAQRSYRDLAEHYGFLISPCRPRTPRHKGKVESGVRYVKRNALAGRSFRSLQEANRHLERWVLETAGLRDHGTTHERPLDRFERERKLLRPLPPVRFEIAVWKKAKVHSDCHVVFDYSFYSAPHRLLGQKLWLKATAKRVELYRDYERITSHPRADRRGRWVTNFNHLPPEKLEGLMPRPVEIRAKAHKIGPSTVELIDRLLGERPMDRIRGAQGILKLSKKFGSKRLERACRRALAFDELRYGTIKSILLKGLDSEPLESAHLAVGPVPKTAIFARTTSDGVSWN
jgi:transposase